MHIIEILIQSVIIGALVGFAVASVLRACLPHRKPRR